MTATPLRLASRVRGLRQARCWLERSALVSAICFVAGRRHRGPRSPKITILAPASWARANQSGKGVQGALRSVQ
eukprot:4781207-Pyramimonas_sp.AAC.1